VLDDAPHHGEIPSLLARLGPDKPDLVIAGHRHAWMVGRVEGVPIVSSDQHGVGFTQVRFCATSSGRLALRETKRHTAFWSGSPRTELGFKVAAAIAPWEARVRPIADAVVASIPRECAPKSLNGVALADQVARATAETIASAATPPAGTPVVGFVNSGALRAPLPAGTVRFGELFTVFPFENSVAACGTNGAGLRRFIDNAIRKDASKERFPLGISGAKLVLRRDRDASLSLLSITLDGQKAPVEDATPVWLALSDFVLYGGDGLLDGVACAPKVASQTRVRDAWKAILERERACDGPSRNVSIE
jgi:2',3'-cyclic-nucleotide 2'-phosphodiesterase (5'-nucleotidase family)